MSTICKLYIQTHAYSTQRRDEEKNGKGKREERREGREGGRTEGEREGPIKHRASREFLTEQIICHFWSYELEKTLYRKRININEA